MDTLSLLLRLSVLLLRRFFSAVAVVFTAATLSEQLSTAHGRTRTTVFRVAVAVQMGQTALHSAAKDGFAEIAGLLINAKADLLVDDLEVLRLPRRVLV